ncbi:substrate-binding domain-containing protein [Flavobacterium lindanitolerans]|uniref:PstS family phosphate ABC transporter substrate-binding protein n=1 Tax=Flavobacterium lindanitolerans TaxID=428988 RepID=UPI00280A3115|nr:substrate-binding domain-containing protein [Flavobacterium lindanitolerans]MDQ7960734.1 substrate-binding domain-containing protein [Flavobacterium lindanitolerans]
MPKYLRFLFYSFGFIMTIFFIDSCADKKKKEDQTATFYVDETVMPMMDDQLAVFQSERTEKINLVPKTEGAILDLLKNDTTKLVVMSRVLSKSEEKRFTDKGIVPRITQIAIDGVALIANNKAKDSVIDLQNVIDFMNGKPVASIKGLVFDNANSSTIDFLSRKASVTKVDSKNIFALKSNNDVIKYISENEGYIGVIGVNWMTQPMPDMLNSTTNVKVLAVKNVKSEPNSSAYYKPSQTNLAEGLYPLTRKIYMLNYEGSVGLGMGFATFVAGDIGQRIVLKSGLAPVRLALREVKVRKDIENK